MNNAFANVAINDAERKPNEVLYEATFYSKALGQIRRRVWAPYPSIARARIAANYCLDLKEEAATRIARVDP